MKIKALFWFTLNIILFSPSAFASGAGGGGGSLNIVTPNQAQNSQSATGVVNQSPIGGVNSNYQINNGWDTTHGFGPGIYCRTPALVLGGYGAGVSTGDYYGYNSSAGNYGLVVGLSIPLSGSIGIACRALVEEIVKQRQLDTSLNLIKQCALLKREGIEFDEKAFPEFKACSSVYLTNGKSISNSSLNKL